MRSRIRWAAAPTIVVSLVNVPVAFTSGSEYLSDPAAWAITLLGAVGLVSAAALVLRQAWAHPAVLAIGLVNVVAGVTVLVTGHGEGTVGTVLGLAVVATAWPSRTTPLTKNTSIADAPHATGLR
jgi:hypothetical protein